MGFDPIAKLKMNASRKWTETRRALLTLTGVLIVSLPALSQTNPAPALFPADQWKSSPPPFGFKYDGKDSAAFLSKWQKSQETVPSEGGRLERQTFTDPATNLKVTAEVRTFNDYPAVEWVLKFTNQGKSDTPIIEDIEPLLATLSVPANSPATLHYSGGSTGSQNDFEPASQGLGKTNDIKLGSNGGRSSDGALPYFNLQVDNGGIIGAIGWTGNWTADFARNADGTAVTLTAGMRKTHLVLHPGEEIRTARILILNWTGPDTVAAQNIWRRLLLAYYSPQEKGKPEVGPVSTLTWGNDLITNKLARVKEIVDKKIGFDVYWVDAGWYGNEDYHNGSTVANTPWPNNRGSWWPNKQCYPDGFKPLSDLLHQNGMDFLLWIEPEEADPGTDLIKQHPEWFFKRGDGGGLLNLGDPAARKGITDIVSDILTKGGIDWYRQDFNIAPDGLWTDEPNRVGMTEIRYIEGLYAYWDELRARHPGLKIDNCASGGRRLDLEMITRSMSLWRTDYSCGTPDSTGPQVHTIGLSPWVPLNAGCCEGNTTYNIRSAYSTALVIDGGCNLIIPKDDAWLKAGLAEYHEAQPYFYGDFYPLLPYNRQSDYWSATQFDRPDLKAGLALFFRRPDSLFPSLTPHLRNIDPAASYSVEMRAELGPGAVKTMSGKELADLTITIPDQPGSVLMFYKQQ
jgi:alpha-galactosidase